MNGWLGFSRHQFVLLALFAACWAVFAINPNTRQNWLLENALVAVFAPFVLLTARYFRLSDLSYTLITVYLLMHLVGGNPFFVDGARSLLETPHLGRLVASEVYPQAWQSLPEDVLTALRDRYLRRT